MKRRRLGRLPGVILMVSIIALVLVSDAWGQKPQPNQPIKTLKIGSTLPFAHPIGIVLKKYYEVMIPKFNESGGLVVKGQRYNIELIQYDDKYTADGGRAAAERLINQDKVKFIVGTLGSAPALGIIPISEPAKVLLVSSCGTDKLIQKANKYTVRGARTGIQAVCVGPGFTASQFPKAKTVVICTPDDDTGKYYGKAFKRAWIGLGLNVLNVLSVKRNEMDFSPLATKIKSINPDLVDFSAWGGGATEGLYAQALYETGWRGAKLFKLTSLHDVLSRASKGALEGAIGLLMTDQTPRPPAKTMELIKTYKAKYGSFDNAGLPYFGSWDTFLAAVKKADSLNVDDIMAAFEGLQFDACDGPARMIKRPDLGVDRCAEVVYALNYQQFKNGKSEFIGQYTVDQIIATLEKTLGHSGKWK